MPAAPGYSADSALTALVLALDEGVLIFDDQGVCRAAGRRATEILGFDAAGLARAEVLGRAASICKGSDALAPLAAAAMSGERTVVDPIEIERPQRTVVWTSVPFGIHDGGDPQTPAPGGGRIDLIRDVTRERRAEQTAEELGKRLELESTLDDLTGLTNRKRFEEEALREHRRAQREWISYAVARIDVDGMGGINEKLGWEVGSELLKRIGEELKSARREYDVVARWKDDEFVLLLPRADAAAARKVLRRTIEGAHEKARALAPGVTLSVGAAVWSPPSAEGPAEILGRAAEALAAARSKGKGKMVVDVGTADWKTDPGIP